MDYQELLDELRAQAWAEFPELSVRSDERGRLALEGDVIVPHVEGMERLSYLISDVATLCQETDDPALAWARLHAEMLPCPADEEYFPFRIWTDPLPPPSFDRLAAILCEALDLTDEDEEQDGGGFIDIDNL
jgi:hypothetical protein